MASLSRVSSPPVARPQDVNYVARLSRRLRVVAVSLAVFTTVLYATYGSAVRLLELSWFNAFGFTFQAVASAAVSFIAFGRYRVLQDSASYWIGMGFTGFAVALLGYVLAWPGLLPDGTSVLANLPGTAAWLPVLAFLALWVCLQLAAWSADQPGSWRPVQNWWVAAFTMAALTALAGVLIIAFEHRLPLLVQANGAFAPLLTAVYLVQIVLFAFGTWSGAYRARRNGDPLLAVTAGFQLALFFVVLWVMLETARYGLWWYSARILLIGAGLAALFGALSDHVKLLRQEREKTQTLAAVEAELQQNYARMNASHAELQQQEQRKDQFLATLAHELRNPLAPMQSAVDILALRPGDPAVAQRVLPILQRQLVHMKHLVDDLLDVSRITQGKITLARQAVDLSQVIQDVVQAAMPQFQQNVHLDLTAEPLLVLGDEVRVRQIMGNILDNALKYTRHNGSIWITSRREGEDAVLRVRDDGIGISPELLERIFEPFVQADAKQGLGLGLALVHQLVEMHGGKVQADSAGLGCGSEFVVRLPCSSGLAPPEPPGASGACSANRAQRILVVDDNADAVEGLRMLLELKGQVVATAPDGPAALREVERLRPEVVFLDLGLPGMDGFEVARRIRRMPRGETVYLVAVTGWGQEEDKARSREAGFDEHLTKPVDLARLDAALARVGAIGA
jgi:signal transduction histidine kinase/ActR/RegA family two-component response regulator